MRRWTLLLFTLLSFYFLRLNSSVWDSPEIISSRKGDVGFSDNVFRQNVERQIQNKQECGDWRLATEGGQEAASGF